jgi:hypothetical protein
MPNAPLCSKFLCAVLVRTATWHAKSGRNSSEFQGQGVVKKRRRKIAFLLCLWFSFGL